jgi:hypothetical protein
MVRERLALRVHETRESSVMTIHHHDVYPELPTVITQSTNVPPLRPAGDVIHPVTGESHITRLISGHLSSLLYHSVVASLILTQMREG